MMTSPIVPAVIPRSYEDLVSAVAMLDGVPELHVDIVDGVFVDAVSWPYSPTAIPSVAHRLLAPFSLEVDLMVEDQLGAASAWLAAGADQLVFHIEVISPIALELFAAQHNVTVAVAAHNHTPYETLARYLPFVDYVQVMGIAQIGSQGQPFDTCALDRIAQIRHDFPQLPISLDGSVNAATLPRLLTLGLDRLIVGSAIMAAPDPKEAYRELSLLAHSQQG